MARGRRTLLLTGQTHGELAVGKLRGTNKKGKTVYEVSCMRCGAYTTLTRQEVLKAKSTAPCRRKWCKEKDEPVGLILKEIQHGS